jgi:predicted alpha/beta-hydrolase family hydrolase
VTPVDPKNRTGRAIAALLCLIPLLIAGVPAHAQEIVTLSARAGVTQTFFIASLPKDPQAIGILFPGSGGFIRIRREEEKIKFDDDNFLVRSRAEFIKRGVVAAIVDAPSDQQRNWGMTDEFRKSEEHFTDISSVATKLGKRFSSSPLFLIGTSRGAVSAAALGAWFGPRIAGVVLTASMFRPAGRRSNEPGSGLSGFDFSSIKTPLLFVHHVSDQCVVTPYGDAARLVDHYPLISVFGGRPQQSDPCGPLSAHGFFGKEPETIEQIVNWMLKRPFQEEVK